MNKKENHINLSSKDKIEQYLSGELSEQEQHAFEKEMLKNPFLNDALEGWEAISTNERNSLYTFLEENAPKTKERKINAWWWYSAAASLLLIFVASYWVRNEMRVNDIQAVQIPQTEESLSVEEPSTLAKSESEEEGITEKPEENAQLTERESLAENKAVLSKKEATENSIEINPTSKVAEEPVPVIEEEVITESDDFITEIDEVNNTTVREKQIVPPSLADSSINIGESIAMTQNRAKKARLKEIGTNKGDNESNGFRMALAEEQSNPIVQGSKLTMESLSRNKVMLLFRSGYYEAAAEGAEQLLQTTPQDTTLLYLNALSWLETRNLKKAENTMAKFPEGSLTQIDTNNVLELIRQEKWKKAIRAFKQYELINDKLIPKK